ncbi:MAG: tetratricopeptide repeat protein [Elusimicrobiota bacterium]
MLPGISALVGPLFEGGSLKEAARTLQRLAAAGAPAWETYLWLGRIEEARGRVSAARRAFKKAAASGPPTGVIEAELARFQEKAGKTAAGRLSWPEEFAELMCRRRYAEAFLLGEQVLDRPGSETRVDAFMWPWSRRGVTRMARQRFCKGELLRLDAARRSGKRPRWFAYYRAVLLCPQGRQKEAMAEYPLIKSLDPTRYAWMLQPFVLAMFTLLEKPAELSEIIRSCRLILRHSPGLWACHCYLAEALLAQGQGKAAWAEFRRVESSPDPVIRSTGLTWHGEALLWLGRYREAFTRLNEAEALGAKTFVYGWRGAARLKLGDGAAALKDLDAAISIDPADMEAYVWRAEALRLAGRPALALKDLDYVLAREQNGLWAYLERVLARLDLGDVRGAASDFAAAEAAKPLETCHIKASFGLAGAVIAPDSLRRAAEAGLAMGKGVRRPENYTRFFWMGPSRRYP